MNLKAKPIIKNQYWVITDGDKKVGNVVADGSGFDVKVGNNIEHFNTTTAIEKNKQIQFESILKHNRDTKPAFATYPVNVNKVHNSIFDVKRKLHLFTKTSKSKCYYVGGWFLLKQGEEYETILCPKYIFIQRYPYIGPFMTEAEAKISINSSYDSH